MKNARRTRSCVALTLLGFISSAVAAEKFTAKSFAGADGNLDEQQAALYVAYRDKEPLSKFLKPGETTLDSKMLVTAMRDKLIDLRFKTGHKAPWTWQELDRAYPAKKTGAEESAAVSAWKNIEGLTKAKPLGKDGADGSLGPLRLRKNLAETQKDLKEAKGATVGFSNNFLIGGDAAWNSEGSLDYPVKWKRQGAAGSGQSITMEIGPATEWKLAQVQGDNTKDVQELDFSLPMTAYISPGTKSSALWVVQGKPYLQTDFIFEHEIYGGEASTEYVGWIFGQAIYLGGFMDIGTSGLQYQLRVIPKLDYSATEQGGRYTTRKPGDDWFRTGGTVSLDFRLGGQTFNPLDAGISYQFLDTLSGSGDFSHLFKTHATWWLSESAGLTLEYSEGDTPVAAKRIKLLTLGLEFKY
jgi:hypothetical protein